MLKRVYVAACDEAKQYQKSVVEDPMTKASGAPVDEIMEGYLKRHCRRCMICTDASIEASMP